MMLRRFAPLLLAAVLLTACGPKDQLPDSAPATATLTATPQPEGSGVARGEAEPTPSPTPEPTLAPAMATAHDNATKDAPQITDPTTWNEAGKTLMEQLAADYAADGMTLDAQDGYPYLLAVNRAASTVTVYTTDEDNRYTVPFMAMVCSGGTDTPTGYWATPVNYQWRLLVGPCYGQYATRIYSGYLFHSVPCTPPASTGPTSSTACPTTPSTRTTWNTTSSTSWAPLPAWDASGFRWWM